MSEAVLKIEGNLIHFGRKGMKWGTRKAGTGAPSRRSKGSGSKGKSQKPHPTKHMSNDELRKVIDRMKLDKQYSEMSAPKTSEGKKFAKSVMESSGKTAVAAVVSTAVGIAIAKAVKKPPSGGSLAAIPRKPFWN